MVTYSESMKRTVLLRIWRDFERSPNKIFLSNNFYKKYGMGHHTVNRYLFLFERLGLIERVDTYTHGGKKHLVRYKHNGWRKV